MATPLISIILPTYNRCEMLRGALETLLTQQTGDEFRYEIVVVDNASTDATKEVVEQAASGSAVPVKYIYHAVPGPAPARNAAVEQAEGEWLAFFDDDELANPDWLRQLYLAARQTGAAIVGGAMRLDLPQELLDQLGHVVRSTLLREIDYYRTIRRYTKKRLPGTNNALVARHVFQAIGAFDPAKIGAGSDSDFFLRARGAGIELFYTPHAVVRHRVASNRLTTEYFRWDAHQGCTAFAGLDYKYKGRGMLVARCLARFAHAALVVVPRLVWAELRRNRGDILGQKVRLWRAEAYFRTTMAILAPAWFPQEKYFADLEFRRGRIIGKQGVPMEATS